MRDILEDAESAIDRGEIGPGKSNRGQDKPKFPKRFYTQADVQTSDEGFVVQLDGKNIKTPGKQSLVMPTQEAAQLVADEWNAIETEINPLLMPVTRLANTALDGVVTQAQAVMEDILRYAGTDLLCYRADTPEGLVEKQREHWDPILDWAEIELGAQFVLVEGVMHQSQPREAIAAFGARLKQHDDPFRLAALHTFTSLSGSALISLALAEGLLTAETAWAAAHVDEDWNIGLWGEDYEAAERRKQRAGDFEAAHKLLLAVS